MSTPNLDELKNKVEQFTSLLNDPQPGLFAWQIVFQSQAKELAELLREYSGK